MLNRQDRAGSHETRSAIEQISSSILELASRVPLTDEPVSRQPAFRAGQIAAAAQRKTAAVSAVAALPPGPIGLLTLVPEMAVVWRIQSQMVADIAGAHGKAQFLSPDLMLHCLFQHSAGRAIGGLAVRLGERVLVRNASFRSLQPMARAVAGRVARRTFARSAARFVPGLGSAAIAVYAWRDTAQVARTAEEVFSRDIVQDEYEAQPAGDNGQSTLWSSNAKGDLWEQDVPPSR